MEYSTPSLGRDEENDAINDMDSMAPDIDRLSFAVRTGRCRVAALLMVLIRGGPAQAGADICDRKLLIYANRERQAPLAANAA